MIPEGGVGEMGYKDVLCQCFIQHLIVHSKE